MSGKNKNRKKPTQGSTKHRVYLIIENAEAYRVRNHLVRKNRRK